MRKKGKELLTIPPALRQEFWQDCLSKNRISLLVICILIFGMELFNIARVLFWSHSGLRSVNNRIYFTLYCALLLAAALSLLLQYLLRRASPRTQWAVQFASIAFFLLWHIGLNVYDLMKDPASGTYPYITAIVGTAMFIQMPFGFSGACFGLGYALFMLGSASALDSGTTVNLTITTIVALTISLTRCRHAVTDLAQRREISRMNAQLQQLLQKDPLTGLCNKKATQDCIARSLEEDAQPEALALYMADLDDFKSVNDRFGHPCGDYVLTETARRLHLVFPGAVCIGRTGGDEFAVLLRGVSDAKVLEQAGHRLLRVLSEICWEGQRLGISCSIGIIRVRRPGGYEQIYAEADRALYDAKRQGKGRCCFSEIP